MATRARPATALQPKIQATEHPTPGERAAGRSGRLIGELGQFGDYKSEESSVEDRGLELDKCSRSKCASLDSIAASRAFSFLSCSVSLSICFVLCLEALISLSNCFVLSLEALIFCSTSGSRRQLSVCNHKRH